MADVIIKKEGDPVIQISVMLQNRVGSLSSLLKLIKQHGEEIVGFSMQDAKDATIVRLILTDPDKIRRVFQEKGIPHTTCRMVVVAMRDASSGMDKCLQILHAGETNVDFAYTLLAQPDGKSLIAFHLCDHLFGSEILRRAGIQVLYQQDISR